MCRVLQQSSGLVDSGHIEELESQLSMARSEIQSMTFKLAKQNISTEV